MVERQMTGWLLAPPTALSEQFWRILLYVTKNVVKSRDMVENLVIYSFALRCQLHFLTVHVGGVAAGRAGEH